MKSETKTIALLVLAFAVIMSIPWLVPNTGWLALFGFVPLLCAERVATGCKVRRFWMWHYLAFVLWNAITTFWIWNATAGGAVFAILANAAQMSLVFGLFRFSRRYFRGVLPYIFLMVMWISWERFYFSAEISWPWLTLGNAFARTTSLVQWYSVTGTLGGSLWVWLVSLGTFGIMSSLSGGAWQRMNRIARSASVAGLATVIIAPAAVSLVMFFGYEEKSEKRVSVLVGQPDIDIDMKFGGLSQKEQTARLLDLFASSGEEPDLFVAPETFTSDILLNDISWSPTVKSFAAFLKSHPSSRLLFGASAWERFSQRSRPSDLAREDGPGWIESRNSAIVLDSAGRAEVYHKSKLVVGVEKTPYPRIFTKIDDMLGGVMGRCVPQDKVSCLHLADGTPFGCPVCYESVYGEYCTGYVREGAGFLAVITNDAWWGDTPGYRQHMSYSRLRAIELRRDIARCANTGISAFINQRGDVISSAGWAVRTVLPGSVNVNYEMTPFAEYGDITGRACTLAFLLMLLLLVVRTVSGASRRESA